MFTDELAQAFTKKKKFLLKLIESYRGANG
jgi:hypothetical protein